MNIHFIGVGGIGISALAQYYLSRGRKVSGSDLEESETTSFLKEKGAKIFIGKHKPENIPAGSDLIIFSPAVQNNNPELKRAKELKIKNPKLKIFSYPQALGEITKKHYTIAVSGTHGKSTTTAMAGLVLTKAGLDPTVIIGTKLKEFGHTNFRPGKSRYLLIEADEYAASFLSYHPKIILLLNIEREHLDYYKNLGHILKTYKQYIGHLPRNGILIVNGSDKNINKLIFNFQSSIPNKVSIYNFQALKLEKGKLKSILKVPGQHNVLNGLAVLKLARILKIPDATSFKALAEFKGTWRRFEEKKLKIGSRRLKIISDYGHHPTEILATLKAAREKYKNDTIWLVFQPHQYQRTFYLLNGFIKAFQTIRQKKLDEKTIITDIFDVAGRENREIKQKISGKKLVKKISDPKTIYIPKQDLADYLKNNVRNGQVLIIMGAGNIYKLAERLSTD